MTEKLQRVIGWARDKLRPISISGGAMKYSTVGIKIMAIKPGTNIANAHVPQLSSISLLVALATNSTTSGLGAVAVINMADVIGLLW